MWYCDTYIINSWTNVANGLLDLGCCSGPPFGHSLEFCATACYFTGVCNRGLTVIQRERFHHSFKCSTCWGSAQGPSGSGGSCPCSCGSCLNFEPVEQMETLSGASHWPVMWLHKTVSLSRTDVYGRGNASQLLCSGKMGLFGPHDAWIWATCMVHTGLPISRFPLTNIWADIATDPWQPLYEI